MNKGFVYLIGEIDNPNLFKIGMTRKHDVSKRLKELQTGNNNSLHLVEYFETKYPSKVENLLHRHFKDYRQNGEWFELKQEHVNNFLDICEQKEKICDALKNNPFF